jgi:hypothetical protein
MITHIKWILIGLVLLGCIALFTWGDKIQPGTIFAGLATFVAAIKSKLFGKEKVLDKIQLVKNTHEYKRREWEREKIQYELRYDSLKTRLDSINKRIEDLSEQLDRTTRPGYKAELRSEEEILFWLRNN